MLTKSIVVLGFILFDIITGFLKGIYNKDIDSTALRKGLLHKATEVLVFGGSILLEYAAASIELGIDLPLSGAVTIYIAAMECTSIIENLCEVNPKLKKLFQPYLLKLRGNDDGNDENEGH